MPRPDEMFLQMPRAKLRVGACLSSLFALILVTLARCGQPHGQFKAVPSAPPTVEEPFDLPPTIEDVFGVYNGPSYQEPIGPPNLCTVRNGGTQKADDVMIAYQYWMGPGYSIADFGVYRNRRTVFEAIISPHGFPQEGCDPGALSEKSVAEFCELVEKLHVCDDPPRPTWENVGIEPLCVRKGNDVCLIGIGDRIDPRMRILRMAVARLAIYGCTSKLSMPTGPT